MHTSLYADDRRSSALAAARPLLVDVVPAREVVPHLAAGGACHAGPPIAAAGDVRADARGARGRAGDRGRRADDPAAALALADAGDDRRCSPTTTLGGVGPMSGRRHGLDAGAGRRATRRAGRSAWCPLNEGSGKVLRYGADDDEVVDAAARGCATSSGPALARRARRAPGRSTCSSCSAARCSAGDECHHRTDAGTALLARRAGRRAARARSTAFIARQRPVLPQRRDGARRRSPRLRGRASPGSALVTVVARNGVEVGVQALGHGRRAGSPGPAALPDPAAPRTPGYAPERHAARPRRLGDRGGLRPRRAGRRGARRCRRRRSGWTRPTSPAITARLRRDRAPASTPSSVIGATGDAPAILGVDARAVVATGIVAADPHRASRTARRASARSGAASRCPPLRRRSRAGRSRALDVACAASGRRAYERLRPAMDAGVRHAAGARRPPSQADRVYEELRGRLLRGELPARPAARRGAARRRVRRRAGRPVREALRRLEGDGHLVRDAVGRPAPEPARTCARCARSTRCAS